MYDINGALRKFLLPAYHIPTCKSRLISTSSLLRTCRGEHITRDENSLTLSGIDGDPSRSQIVAFNSPTTRLPTTTAYVSKDTGIPAQSLYNIVTTASVGYQFKKIEKHINLNEQKIISFEEIDTDSLLIQNILDEENYEKKTKGKANNYKASIN